MSCFPRPRSVPTWERSGPTAEQVEHLGYTHVLAYDHVLGADPSVHPGWSGPYDLESTFHEPFVLFGFLAGFTNLEFATGIVILPQRQTALVAKQAAEVDLLSGGRLRLGVGLGWNAVEYEALGKTFSDRGKRVEEQVGLLRRLWTRALGHPRRTLRARDRGGTGAAARAATHPGVVRRPVAPAYRRAGRLGDGWLPQVPPGPKLDQARAIVEQAARDAGRDPSSLGMEGRVSWGDKSVDKLVEQLGRWRAAGASHASVNTMGAGLETVDDHLRVLAEIARALELVSP